MADLHLATESYRRHGANAGIDNPAAHPGFSNTDPQAASVGAGGFDSSLSLMRQSGQATREGTVRLNAPTKIVFYIGVALMAIGIIAFYGDFLDAGKHIAFWCATGGGMVLAAGATLKGF